MNVNRLWLAVLLSGAVHGTALAGAVVVWLWPSYVYTPPQLLEAYGDSDREGFPVGTIAVNPGAWQEADDHTPGGDGVPEPLPERERPPDLTPAPPEPSMPLPASVVVADQTAGQQAAGTAPAADQPAGKLPGEPGGARMAKGTPSDGGKVGTRTGVRLASGGTPPVYPQAAREAGIEGTVVILFRVSVEGEVLEAKVHKSSRYKILDDAALRWAQKQRFIPATVNGVPVEREATREIEFYLYTRR
jgi:TonB family protein